ncbi:hypothetical protein GP486_005005 [Trichoglossum hirsutum]|uniref:Uncharacterized protein n=1 Tax=Trichoglossum hirsutum TaxID=265104 RepID=A0A9P8RNL9_9PEZI|nr:hypothetical protein GP486_005005 [Trichoglossum hirsutum]
MAQHAACSGISELPAKETCIETSPIYRHKKLTENDSTVLEQIFDPESAPVAGIQIDASLPENRFIHDSAELQRLRSQEVRAIQMIEGLASSSRGGQPRENAIDAATSVMSKLIAAHPTYASAYNNRAQMRRLQHGDHVLVNPPTGTRKSEGLRDIAEAILHDLNTAINLATPPSPTESISKSQALILAQAHTQRGALLHATAKALAHSHLDPSEALATPHLFPGWGAERFEEASSRDFFLGGRYGNGIGRAMAVHTNPYAKLCGSIVQEAIKKEFRDQA